VGTERDGATAVREKDAGSEQSANETEKLAIRPAVIARPALAAAAAGRVESLVAETTSNKVSEKTPKPTRILGTPRRDEDDPNFRASRPVVGDAYYERKARVLCAEQKVLRAVDAEVNVPRVASALLNVARAVRAPKAVAKLALVALTDLLFATASPSRLARGLFFGAPREPSETTAVGDDGSRGVKTAILAARAPLDLAGDASAAAVRLAARLCGYALRRDDNGGAPIWTRAVETREDERKRKRSSPECVSGAETNVSPRELIRGDSEIQKDDERFERGRGRRDARSRSVVGGDGVRPRARRAHRAGRAGRADARRAPRRRAWSVGGENEKVEIVVKAHSVSETECFRFRDVSSLGPRFFL
jgi:hypothetical protein